MKFEELKGHISKGNLRSAYIIMGDDDYLIDAAKKMFLSLITNPEFNHTVIDAERADSTVNALNVYPFMSEYGIVEISYDKEIRGLKRYLENPNPKSILLLTVSKLEKHHKDILSYCEIIDCNRLSENTLVKWVKNKVNVLGSAITEEAAAMLVNYCNRLMTRIFRETEKLATYAYGKTIETTDIEALVTPDTEVKIFQLGDAVAKKNGALALEIYRELNNTNDNTVIFGALYSHFRKLLYCALSPNEDKTAALGLKDYALKIMSNRSRDFGAVRLKKIVDGFHELDFGMKNGTYTDKAVLEGYLMKILIS